MICPECKSEYRQGFLTCADCGTELVLALPEDEPADDGEHDYVEYEDLMRLLDPSYVAFIRSVLTAEGFDYYVLGEHTSYLFSLPVEQIIRVRADQIERAREILDDIESNTPPDDPDDLNDI